MTDEEAERILQRVAEKMSEDILATMYRGGTFASPRPTALRIKPAGTFEVVEIHDDGSIIEPAKPCPRCGPMFLCSKHVGT